MKMKISLPSPDTEVQIVRPTPQCDRVREIQDKSQAIHEFFLEFLPGKGIELARLSDEGHLYHIHVSIEKLVAEFFGVDLNELENEKRRMIQDMRLAQAKKEIERELPVSRSKK